MPGKNSELPVQLRRQRLVMGDDQRRALQRLDDVGDRVGLAGAGDAEQGLGGEAALDAVDEPGDRRRLVAGRLIVGLKVKLRCFAGLIVP